MRSGVTETRKDGSLGQYGFALGSWSDGQDGISIARIGARLVGSAHAEIGLVGRGKRDHSAGIGHVESVDRGMAKLVSERHQPRLSVGEIVDAETFVDDTVARLVGTGAVDPGAITPVWRQRSEPHWSPTAQDLWTSGRRW